MSVITQLNQFLWSGPILILLLGTHLYFTFRLGFVQRKIKQGILLSLRNDSSDKKGFSSFGSLTTTLAATLGTGNIVGVSTAVYLGGPGAVFWCWITGVLGMATTYAETWLCCHYHSTPIFLLSHHLKRKGLAILYSIALCLSAFFIGSTTQCNAITDACKTTFNLSPIVVAGFVTIMAGLLIFLGQRWLENFTMFIVPFMAMFFLGGCLIYLLLHGEYIFPAIKKIISSAFGFSQIGGGLIGFSVGSGIRYGIARGLFTNEAGLGTAGLIAGNVKEVKAEKQAFISMSATFWDTVILCGITGIVLTSFLLEFPQEFTSYSPGSLTTAAFHKLPFWGDEILTIAIFFFALATIVGWSYFGKQGFSYLFQGQGEVMYKLTYCLMVFIGGVMPLTVVWEFADFINLFLLIPSLFILFTLRKQIHTF